MPCGSKCGHHRGYTVLYNTQYLVPTTKKDMPLSLKEDALVIASLVGIGASLHMLATKHVFKYKPEKIWKQVAQGGKFGGMNRPTAGPRTTKELPKGDHALQLYSLGTPNGVKVTTLLEALNLKYGVEYDAFMTNIMELDQFTSGFVRANPNSKIPVLLHFDQGLEKEPIRVFETAAIMIYLCETFDLDHAFLPAVGDPLRAECLSWVMWVQGSAPFLGGGYGHFYHYAPVKIQYAIDRYAMEAKRQLSVLERHLSKADGEGAPYGGGPYLCGDKLTIADLACYPWYGVLVQGKIYGASDEFLQVQEYPSVIKWAQLMSEKETVKKGRLVNTKAMVERHSSKDFESLSLDKDPWK